MIEILSILLASFIVSAAYVNLKLLSLCNDVLRPIGDAVDKLREELDDLKGE